MRDHLVSATARLIAEQRAAGLTVRQIAEEAGVAAGALYNHFDDKDDLLAHGLLAHIDTVERSLARPPAAGDLTLAENLAAYLRYLVDLHEQILPAFAGLFAQPAAIARFHAFPASEKGGDLHQHVDAHLRGERDLGRLGPTVDTGAAASLLIGACYELVLPRLFGGVGAPVADGGRHLRAVVGVLLDGMTGQPG
ncbi:TetR/AcrR family transcriptional regulator [Tsukamurella sp. 1534]|uniref:TetR/AcrR family transcriptional regulator n=1 Tax=Tsukamurella sp. 1534 TaxID=1151061 RepID=UPI00031B2459|nr:TetR/AcrR family transcriptional regulator [Tsukamurella sp. 1534]